MSCLLQVGAVSVGSSVVAQRAAEASTQPLESIAKDTKISAYGGVEAWSASAGGRYRLRVRSNGTVTTPAIRSRGVPFDVDLGPDATGRVVAVYSRCRSEPGSADPDELINWSSGGGCRLRLLDVASERERRLAGVRAPGTSDYLPTVWRGLIVFARRFERRSIPARFRSSFFIKSPGSRRLRRLPIGTQFPSTVLPTQPYPTSTDLRGKVFAFSWSDTPGEGCPSNLGQQRDRI